MQTRPHNPQRARLFSPGQLFLLPPRLILPKGKEDCGQSYTEGEYARRGGSRIYVHTDERTRQTKEYGDLQLPFPCRIQEDRGGYPSDRDAEYQTSERPN